MLKSLMIRVIPSSFLSDHTIGCSVLFAALCRSSDAFVALLNTLITPAVGHPRWSYPRPAWATAGIPRMHTNAPKVPGLSARKETYMVETSFVTARELREALKISRTTLFRLLREGLPSVGYGRLRRFSILHAIEWIDGHRKQTGRELTLRPAWYRCRRCSRKNLIKEPQSYRTTRCVDCPCRSLE